MTSSPAFTSDQFAALRRLIGDAVPHFDGPVSAELIAGGRSNLTYRLIDSTGNVAVLRRPPRGPLAPSAHDVAREYRILAALADTDVPTPTIRLLCEDPDVIGAPFYVMDFVEGAILGDREAGIAYPEGARASAAQSLIDALVALHAVDVDAVGLGELSRREDYIARQLRRWHRQYETTKTMEVPQIEQVHDELSRHIPPQQHTGIVHGDYRLGNVVLGPTGTVKAILDWELTTLGDTTADLGWLLLSWIQPDEPLLSVTMGASAVSGFPTRRDLVEDYCARTGTDPSHLDFYVAFARWRYACIAVGVLARYESGAMGDTLDIEAQRHNVQYHANIAANALRGDW